MNKPNFKRHEYEFTVILLHSKQWDRLLRILQYLIHTDLLKEIIIRNNSPTINLTLLQLTNFTLSYKSIQIINSKKDLSNKAMYSAYAEAKTCACFYIINDYNPAHYLKYLIASFRSDPTLLHRITDVCSSLF